MKQLVIRIAGLGLYTLMFFCSVQQACADEGQFKLDMILASRGDADAQYYVALAYEEGRGVKKDIQKALSWYKKAADQGHGAAQYRMGSFYEFGVGVRKDLKTAFSWYKRAAKSGNPMAKERLDKAAFGSSERVFKKKKVAKKAPKINVKPKTKVRSAPLKAKNNKPITKPRIIPKPVTAQDQTVKNASPEPKKVVSKPAKVDIPDLMNVILKGNWGGGEYSAEFLPSALTSCLKSGKNEVVCFSVKEMSRIVNGFKVTYTAKSVLSDFKRSGFFRVKYYYNATDIEVTDKKGPNVDPMGLRPKSGWQEPPLMMSCRTKNRVNLVCYKGDLKVSFKR